MTYKTRKMVECCDFISDGDHLPPPKSADGVPFITISNITEQNTISFENTMFVPESYYDGLGRTKKAKIGDILYSVVGSYGKPVYISSNKKFVFQRHIAILRPNESVNGSYLYYAMLNPYFYNKVDKLAIGCSQKTVTLDTLRNLEIDLPDIMTQEKIVKVLSAIDAKISVNTKINDNLEQQLKLLYDYWFTQFDFPDENGNPYYSAGGQMVWNSQIKREIPVGWTVCTLDNLCTLRNGINYDKAVVGDRKYRIINVRNISSSSLLINENELDEICLPQVQADKYCVCNQDIIIARSGIPGATRVLYNPSASTIFCGFIICCTPSDKLLKWYLAYYLKMFEGTSATKTGGSILQNVSQDTLKSLSIIVPPNNLMAKFYGVAEKTLNTIHNTLNENSHLMELRDWLLPMLMNGQATISD